MCVYVCVYEYVCVCVCVWVRASGRRCLAPSATAPPKQRKNTDKYNLFHLSALIKNNMESFCSTSQQDFNRAPKTPYHLPPTTAHWWNWIPLIIWPTYHIVNIPVLGKRKTANTDGKGLNLEMFRTSEPSLIPTLFWGGALSSPSLLTLFANVALMGLGNIWTNAALALFPCSSFPVNQKGSESQLSWREGVWQWECANKTC